MANRERAIIDDGGLLDLAQAARIAERIYTRLAGDIDNTEHRAGTLAALEDWLREGDIRAGEVLDADDLADEWATTLGRAPVECGYCGHMVAHADAPAVGDDAAWAALAREHAPWCEWIETRAHRINI